MTRERILRAAKTALALEPITITKFRTKLSEGGLNDFYSNDDYWWPDPTKPDGLPYTQRDGESNGATARSVSIPLSFLGRTHSQALLLGDDEHSTTGMKITRAKVSFGDSLTIKLANGGGFIGTFKAEPRRNTKRRSEEQD